MNTPNQSVYGKLENTQIFSNLISRKNFVITYTIDNFQNQLMENTGLTYRLFILVIFDINGHILPSAADIVWKPLVEILKFLSSILYKYIYFLNTLIQSFISSIMWKVKIEKNTMKFRFWHFLSPKEHYMHVYK